MSTDALPPGLAAALTTAGVAAGADGDDAAGLLTVAEALGVMAGVEEIPGTSAWMPPGPCWRGGARAVAGDR